MLAYADREEHAMGLELSQPGLDHSALVEEVKETTALVILALGSMMHISEEQASPPLPTLLPAPGMSMDLCAGCGFVFGCIA